MLRPPPPSMLVTGVYTDIKQQVNSDDDWSLRLADLLPSLPWSSKHEFTYWKLESGGWLFKLSRSWELIISKSNWTESSQFWPGSWNCFESLEYDSLDTPELLVNLQFEIDRLTWQKYFALFCKTISEIFIIKWFPPISWCRGWDVSGDREQSPDRH